MPLKDALLTTQSYESQAILADRRADAGSVALPLLGLFGETGSLLSEVKKKQRDAQSYIGYAGAVVEELGDVLWYLTIVAFRIGASLSEIAHRVAYGGSHSGSSAVPALPFAVLQHPVLPLPPSPTPTFENTLITLAGKVGALVAAQSAEEWRHRKAEWTDRLEQILSLLVRAADEAGVTLERAATANLAKIFDRWPQKRVFPELFDAACDKGEQLPRLLTIDMFEKSIAGNKYVFQQCNSINIGDRLTDNAPRADDYRFHDVFHYAYAAVLGWSPVTRALFRLKRKSDPAIDESEDGARPALIEEGVSSWIFGEAEQLNFFEGMKAGDLAFGLLKHVRQFVGKYEVSRCPLWLWEDAILQGFAAFRFVRLHRRARFVIDLASRQLAVQELPE